MDPERDPSSGETARDALLEEHFELMRSIRAPLRDADAWTDRRDRALPRLGAALRQATRARRTRRRKIYGGAALTALAAAAGLLLTWGPRGNSGSGSRGEDSVHGASAAVVRGGRLFVHGAHADPPRSLGLGDQLELTAASELETSARSRAELTNAAGARIDMMSSTRLALDDSAGDVVRLIAGEVAIQVPKLRDGGSFVVETSRARVVVHGTQFSVRLDGPDAFPCVQVSEGRVSVVSGETVLLTAGQSHGCEDAGDGVARGARGPGDTPDRELGEASDSRFAPGTRALRGSRSVPAPANLGREMADARTTSGSSRGGSPDASATLAEENRIFQAALRDRRRGALAAARAGFEDLLRRHPSSPLAPAARAELGTLVEPAPAPRPVRADPGSTAPAVP